MSYSFTVVADTKEDAKEKIAINIADVMLLQPTHEADCAAAIACACAFIDILKEPSEGSEIRVSVNGYLSWNRDDPPKFNSANISVNAAVLVKV